MLKRFSGQTEDEFFAYLAGISRNVARECVRRQLASKRTAVSTLQHRSVGCPCIISARSCPSIEEKFFYRELIELAVFALQDTPNADRNRLIATLHFFDGLSAMKIAQIEAIGLSHGGVKKVLSEIRQQVRILITV